MSNVARRLRNEVITSESVFTWVREAYNLPWVSTARIMLTFAAKSFTDTVFFYPFGIHFDLRKSKNGTEVSSILMILLSPLNRGSMIFAYFYLSTRDLSRLARYAACFTLR